MKQGRSGTFETIDVDDPASVSEWAAGMCRGMSVEQAAALFRVEPTIAAVVENVSKTIPQNLRQVAAEACEAELIKSAGPDDASRD